MTIEVSTKVAGNLTDCKFTVINNMANGSAFTSDYYTYIMIDKTVNGVCGFLEEFLNISQNESELIKSMLDNWRAICELDFYN